jgi:hypothetical protein
MVRLFSTAAVENLNAVIYVWGIDIPEAGGIENEHRVTGITDVTDMVHIVQGLESRLNRSDFIFCKGWGLGLHIKGAEPVFGTPARLLCLHLNRRKTGDLRCS